MSIEWTGALAIGVEKIDSQHQEMFERIKTLREALRGGRAGAEIETSFDSLVRFVKDHFQLEERYMRRLGYREAFAHQAEHSSFANDLADFKRRWKELYKQGEPTSFLELQMERRFSGWLTEHISKVDKDLGEFLADKL